MVSTKTVDRLVLTAQRLEEAATTMHAVLQEKSRVVAEAVRRASQGQRRFYEAALCALATDLREAEVVDKEEAMRLRASLEEDLVRERAAARLTGEARRKQSGEAQAAVAATTHAVQMRELRTAMDAQRADQEAELERTTDFYETKLAELQLTVASEKLKVEEGEAALKSYREALGHKEDILERVRKAKEVANHTVEEQRNLMLRARAEAKQQVLHPPKPPCRMT